MHLADTYTKTIAHALIGSARTGLHTIPQALADDYAELERLIEEGQEVVSGGARVWRSNTTHEKEAEKVAARLTRLSDYGGREGIIRDHLRPAFEAWLEKFTADRATAGRHANAHGPTLDMLDEPDAVRAAIVRVHQPADYTRLRGIYTCLRGGTFTSSQTIDNGSDPRKAGSLLSECRNIADVFPGWENAGRVGGESAPWPGSTLHIKLGWLLDNGGQLWMPTDREHNAVYRALREKARADAPRPGRPMIPRTAAGRTAA